MDIVGIGKKSLTDEWEVKSRANKCEAMKIRELVLSYVKLTDGNIDGKKAPETVASELKEITIRLTDLLMSSALNPAQRLAVLEKVRKVSFGKFFPSMMQESSDFNWMKVEIAKQAMGMKPLPEISLTPKPR